MQWTANSVFVTRILALFWVAVILAPVGWWKGQVNGWSLHAGLYSVLRSSAPKEDWVTLNWLPTARDQICPSDEDLQTRPCHDWQRVARSSLAMQALGMACAACLVLSTTTARKKDKRAPLWALGLLYLAPMMAIIGVVLFTYTSIEMERSWLRLGPAYVFALVLTPLSSAPLFLISCSQTDGDDEEEGVGDKLFEDAQNRRKQLGNIHMYGSTFQAAVRPDRLDAQLLKDVPRAPQLKRVGCEQGRSDGSDSLCCKGNHELVTFMTKDNLFYCDRCLGNIPQDTSAAGCRECNFDLCPKCWVPELHMRSALFSGRKSKFGQGVTFGESEVKKFHVDGNTKEFGKSIRKYSSLPPSVSNSTWNTGSDRSRTITTSVVSDDDCDTDVSDGELDLVQKFNTAFVRNSKPPDVIEGYLWTLTKELHDELPQNEEHNDPRMQLLSNWRRRWFSIVMTDASAGGNLTLNYLCEQSTGEAEKVKSGPADLWTRFECMPTVDVRSDSEEVKFQSMFRNQVQNTTLGAASPAEAASTNLPSQLFPILLAWNECVHNIQKHSIDLESRRIVLACETEGRRSMWAEGVQRLWCDAANLGGQSAGANSGVSGDESVIV